MLLLKCNKQLLKTYLLLGAASGGMRTVEALAIRIKDIDFDVKPTTVHIRNELSKTKKARDVFISEEATQALRDWIILKYKGRVQTPEDLVFHQWRPQENPNPRCLYHDMNRVCEGPQLGSIWRKKR